MPDGVNGNGMLPKVIAGASVVLSLVLGVVAFTSPMSAEQEVLRRNFSQLHLSISDLIKELHKDGTEQAYHRGQVDQQLKDLRTLTTELDIRLQREMRDVNATTEAKLNALDTRLQSELSNVTGVLRDAIDRSKVEESELRTVTGRNTERMGRFDERIKALEKP